MNITCISIIGFSNSGKTSALRMLTSFFKPNIQWLSNSVIIANYLKKRIAIILEGDTVSIVKRHFSLLHNLNVEFVVCTSHTGETLEQVYFELIAIGLAKDILDAKNNTLLVFKERDCKYCNSGSICSNLSNEDKLNICEKYNNIFTKKIKELVDLYCGG